MRKKGYFKIFDSTLKCLVFGVGKFDMLSHQNSYKWFNTSVGVIGQGLRRPIENGGAGEGGSRKRKRVYVVRAWTESRERGHDRPYAREGGGSQGHRVGRWRKSGNEF